MSNRICPALLRGVPLVVLFSAALVGQSPWVRIDAVPDGMTRTAFDLNRGVVVGVDEFSGRTLEWDGTRWGRVASVPPGPAGAVAVVFVASRGRTLAFNEQDGSTWTWDGVVWTQRATTGPGSRFGTALAYDAVRDRVVLHGGQRGNPTVYLPDTWEWDGSAWSRIGTGPATSSHAMAYDSIRDRTLLYGGVVGFGGSVELRDTWSWDGTTWTRVATSGGAPPRGRGVMAFDPLRDRAVLTVVAAALFTPSETWEWDGGAWTFRANTTTVLHPYDALTYDPVRRVTVATDRGATHVWDGARWTTPVPMRFGSSGRAVAAFDPGRASTVVVGGSGSLPTLEWDGTSWVERSTAGPSGYRNVAGAFDPLRRRLVVFGGSARSPGQETWEWDGATWMQVGLPGPNAPPAREGHALAFDPVSNRVLLFGGATATALLGDTWAWDGARWTLVAPASPNAPSPRVGHGLATDTRRGRVVLFGDRNGGMNDTWEWDGTTWARVATTGPSTRADFGFAFDEARGRAVLYGGLAGVVRLDETWEWDGRMWRQLAVAGFGARRETSMYYDPVLDRVVAFSGDDGTSIQRGDLHALERDAYGVGCGGPAGVPALSLSTGRPLLGTSFDVRLASPRSGTSVAVVGFGVGPALPATSLGVIGLPGCELLLASIPVTRVVPTNAGLGTAGIVLPPDPTLRGSELHAQAFVPDPGANALGIAISNAVVAIVR